jgi:hypothetical protein
VAAREAVAVVVAAVRMVRTTAVSEVSAAAPAVVAAVGMSDPFAEVSEISKGRPTACPISFSSP